MRKRRPHFQFPMQRNSMVGRTCLYTQNLCWIKGKKEKIEMRSVFAVWIPGYALHFFSWDRFLFFLVEKFVPFPVLLTPHTKFFSRSSQIGKQWHFNGETNKRSEIVFTRWKAFVFFSLGIHRVSLQSGLLFILFAWCLFHQSFEIILC